MWPEIHDHGKMTMVRWMISRKAAIMRTMAAGEFKAKCLAVMDEVQATGETVVVTKRGKPVAQIAPIGEPSEKDSPESIFGCLQHMGTITGDIVSSPFTDEEWEEMFNKKWDRFDQGYSQ